MVQVTFEVAHERRADLAEPLFSLRRLSDIWRLSEAAFFVLAEREQVIADHVNAILGRRLLQRTLSLNIATIKKNEKNVDRYRKFQNLFADPEAHETARMLARAAYEELNPGLQGELTEHDIRFDFPNSPNLSNDAEQCNVLVAPGEARTLKTFFPTEDWVASYADNKLTAHVFSAGNEETRSAVGDAAEKVLRGLYGLELDETARRAAK